MSSEWTCLNQQLGIPQRGPWPGAGRNGRERWWGLCEETPQLWSCWLAAWWRKRTRQPLPATPPFRLLGPDGEELPLTSTRCTFGYRWYFGCPRCGRRTEVLYRGRRGLACRRCNRLGYRSQTRRIREPGWLAAWDWGRQFGRERAPEPTLAALAEDLQQHLERELTTLFRLLTVMPQPTAGEASDGDATEPRGATGARPRCAP